MVIGHDPAWPAHHPPETEVSVVNHNCLKAPIVTFAILDISVLCAVYQNSLHPSQLDFLLARLSVLMVSFVLHTRVICQRSALGVTVQKGFCIWPVEMTAALLEFHNSCRVLQWETDCTVHAVHSRVLRLQEKIPLLRCMYHFWTFSVTLVSHYSFPSECDHVCTSAAILRLICTN